MFTDILCFSHLRWDFVYQRPQHLLSRFAKNYNVYFIEEPIYDATADYYNIRKDVQSGLVIVTPHMREDLPDEDIREGQRTMVDYILKISGASSYIAWYYTPMALLFSDHLRPDAIVFDCMDELSAFDFAPPELIALETELINRADVVFTGGQSLFEAKKDRHHNIHPFPSSIDKTHFSAARKVHEEEADQKDIPHPRVGFFGVIDERFDRELVRDAAQRRPDLHFILLGPIVKISADDLPKAPNIHYLGGKAYHQLPRYLSGWDIAMMPFARNASTRFISPTKTPEYLSGGKPVISTSIHDVVHPYGDQGLVHIADTPDDFLAAIGNILQSPAPARQAWLEKVDRVLENMSWDETYEDMNTHITTCIENKLQHFINSSHV